jgi:hypothetical protein
MRGSSRGERLLDLDGDLFNVYGLEVLFGMRAMPAAVAYVRRPTEGASARLALVS